jgi:hypothetical protein
VSQNKLKRPLLFSATAFLFLYPVCLAEAATGATSTSSFGLPQRTKPTLQTATATQQQSLPKTSQGQLQSALESPSFSQSLESLQSTLSTLKAQLATLSPQIADKSKLAPTQALITQLQTQIDATKRLAARYTADTILLKAAVERYEAAKLATANALTNFQTATTNNDTALQELQTAQETERQALLALNSKKTAATQAAQSLEQIDQNLTNINNDVAAQLTALNAARTAYEEAVETKNNALTAKQAAQAAYDQALANYNNNLIPDPNWTAPTQLVEHTRQVEHTRMVEVHTLVPHTTYTTTGGVLAQVYNRNGYNNAPPLPSPNETPISSQTVSDINFQWSSGTILNSGRSEDVIVKFTGNLLFPQDGYYQFYAPADDGTQLTIAGTPLINDWYDKGGGGSTSQQMFMRGGVLYPFTLYYYENGGGAAVSLYYYSLETPYWQLVPATSLGNTVEETTTYEEVITYEQETYYTTETYYTEEPVLTEGTINVDIGEGGEATFNAPAGAAFIGASLRYESYTDPNCGASFNEIAPDGITSVTIRANNSVFGDPCGGQVKHVVGTLRYLGQPTAPLIHDPALLPALEQAQENLATANETFNEADSAAFAAETALEQAQDLYDDTLLTKNQISSDKQDALVAVNRAAQEEQAEQAVYDAAADQLLIKTQNQNSSNLELTSSAAALEAATFDEETAAAEQDENYASTESSKKQYVDTFNEAIKTSAAAKSSISTLSPDPEPEPEPEPTGSPDLPAELTADNLLEVDLEQVDPQELSAEQVEQLQEAALETFETAEQGSAEYEQALDALYLAAEADDIAVPEELAALPAIGPALAGAVELVNFLGNAGADMSPQVREESKKVVVTAVVAAGAAIQSAAAAASISASTRKIG